MFQVKLISNKHEHIILILNGKAQQQLPSFHKFLMASHEKCNEMK